MAASMEQNDPTFKKLYYLHEQIDILQKEASKRKISYIQIKKAATPFLNKPRKKSFPVSLKAAAVVGLVAILYALTYVDTVNRRIKLLQRNILFMVLPVVDWTALHGVQCFIPNIFSVDGERQLQAEDCQNCSVIEEISRLFSAREDGMVHRYLSMDRPFLVLADDHTTVEIQDIVQLYLDDEVMRLYTSCDFASNLSIKRKDHRRLLQGITGGTYTHFYAHWENCFRESAKLFRKVYKRPEFLPTSVELVPSNWVFICSNYTETKSVELPFSEQLIILMQLSGSLKVTLKPKDLCREKCKVLQTTISEGATFITTDFFYDVEYVTCEGESSSITVGLAGKLDL